MNIFSKAAQNLPLTPGQRAFLKLFKGWLMTALGAGIIVGAQYLSSGTADYQRIGLAAGGAALLSLLMAIEKYATSQGDVALAVAAQAGEQKVQQAVQQGVLSPGMTATGTVGLQPSQSSQNPNLTAQGTQTLTNPQAMATTSTTSPQVQFQSTGRHFGDSVVIPAVQPQQPGQPS